MVRVDVDELGIQSVAAIAFQNRSRADGPPQTQDMSLQRLACRRRRTRWPQRLEQRVHWHPLTDARRECREQGLFRPPQPHDGGAVEQLQWTEDTHFHQ